MNQLSDDKTILEKIQQKTVVSQVMEKIKELITSGMYKPGDKIPTEHELADRFGIGRSSIREAIKIFQHLGILESRVPKGTFLCSRSQVSTEAISWSLLLGDDDMWEIMELREIIEEKAFRSMMRIIAGSPEKADEITGNLEMIVINMREAVKTESLKDLIKADFNFHAAVIRSGDNALFFSIYQTLHSFMHEEIRQTYANMKDLNEVAADHEEILAAIKSGDIPSATARHSAHFQRISSLLVGK